MSETQPASVVAQRIETAQQSNVTSRLSHRQLATILEGIADGITVQDPASQLVYANDAAARILGYPDAATLLATPVANILGRFDVLDEAGQPLRVEQLPSRSALHGVDKSSQIIRYRLHSTGEEHWSLVSSQAVLDDSGQVELVVNIFRDITDLKRTEVHQSLLARAATLLSGSIDYETRLYNVAQLIVPDLADWCAVDIVNSDGVVQRLAMAHTNPVKIELARELERRYPSKPDDRSGIYEVLRTGHSLYADLTDALLEASIQDREELALVRQLELKSVIVVPMVARSRTLGAITLAWAESGRRYTPIDLSLAEELARRAALAVDNALLYAQAQQLNTDLEQRVAERTAQVQAANVLLSTEIGERRQAEERVRILNAELEQHVAERTAQLEIVNRDLKSEIAERQRASSALRAVLKRTRELYHISQTIGTVRTPDEVLTALLSSSYLKTASRASIAIFDGPWLKDKRPPQHCTILAAWNRDLTISTLTDQRLTLEEYGLVPPYSRDKPIVIGNVRTKRELPEAVRHRFKGMKTRSLIILPLIAGDQWYGVISLHFKSRRGIIVEDLRHVRGLVNETAIAIDNIRLLKAEAKARQEAEQANNLKMKFLAMISHELRTPLTSIKGFATTLLAEDVQWHLASQRDFLQTINEEADKLGDLIEQLLDLSRLEAGVLRIEPKIQSLDNIIAIAMAQLQTVTANHQLVLDVPRDLPAVRADAQRIAQVLTNLVGNAVKYSPAESLITISAQPTGLVIQIDVADQGSGIAPQERVRVFEPFQQTDSRPLKRTSGAGLGLAICKGLVEAHGGRIWVQDRSGPGTTVSFTLPIGTATP